MKRVDILIAVTTIALGLSGTAEAGSVTLKIDAGSTSGALRAAAFESQASFDAGDPVVAAASPVNGGLATLKLDGLKPGAYGIAVFLDKNDNQQLDANLFGAPTEPFGFSMNPKIGFSAPKFDEFRFDLDGDTAELTIRLNGN